MAFKVNQICDYNMSGISAEQKNSISCDFVTKGMKSVNHKHKPCC